MVLGFTTLERVTHLAEDILSQLRDGKRELTPALVTLILETVDAIRNVLVAIESSGSEGPETFDDLQKRLEDACRNPAKAADPPQTVPAGAQDPEPEAAAAQRGPAVSDSTIRVGVGLLDKLMNLVGELVLTRNQILQFNARNE